MRHRVPVWLFAAAVACCALLSPPRTAWAKKPTPISAADPLSAALSRARNHHRPLVVLFRAEWCEPCNELGAQVLDQPAFAQLAKGFELLTLDHDAINGAAAGAWLGVLGLPTAVVLRIPAKGGPLETGRVEGFDDVAGWLTALHAALDRTEPLKSCPVRTLPAGGGGWEQIPCAIEALRGPEAPAAAEWLEPYVGGVPRSGSSARYALQAASSLARYWLRVRADPQRCADVMAKAWPSAGNNLSASGSIAYWQAKCLHRAGKNQEALAAIDELLARAANADTVTLRQARMIAADFWVHEHLAADRALAVLTELRAAVPTDAEPLYLLARLHRDAGRFADAKAAIAAALALQPGKALYRTWAQGLTKP